MILSDEGSMNIKCYLSKEQVASLFAFMVSEANYVPIPPDVNGFDPQWGNVTTKKGDNSKMTFAQIVRVKKAKQFAIPLYEVKIKINAVASCGQPGGTNYWMDYTIRARYLLSLMNSISMFPETDSLSANG